MKRVSAAAAAIALALALAGCGSSGPAATKATTTTPTTATATSTTAAAGATTTAEGSGPTAPTTAPAPGAVVKDVLATEVDPPGADGRTLTLIRYTIPAGAKLAPHIHPGVQLASIQSGTLTYTVISGTAEVTRADGSKEPLTGPTTTTLNPGDEVQEKGDMVHFGANETSDPVVILATLLTEDGKDLAVTVPQPAG